MNVAFQRRAKQRQLSALKSYSTMSFIQMVVRVMPPGSLVDLIHLQPLELPTAQVFYQDVVELPRRERLTLRSAGTANIISPIRIATA